MMTTKQPVWRVLTAILASVGLLLATHSVEAKPRQDSKKVVASKKAGQHKKVVYKKSQRQQRLAKASTRHQRQLATRQARRQAAMARYEPAGVSRVAWAPSLHSNGLDGPRLIATTALAYNEATGELDFAKNSDRVVSLASITKLMTAMVILDAKLDLDEIITITSEDERLAQGSPSRLDVGFGLTRGEMIKVAMLVSDNRAALALGRTYPGGMQDFVARMNRKARSIGMSSANFVEPTGLSADNKASAADIVRLVTAASQYPLLRYVSSSIESEILPFGSDHSIVFRNTNQLVRDPSWEIDVSKTGYISRAGYCLVMRTRIANTPYVLVIMDSAGVRGMKGNRVRERDAADIKRWLEFKAGVHSSSS